MLVTVATPTYNRAHLLTRLYESLCNQTCIQFEWIIVDDGSSDNTAEVVESFIKENRITINYVQQQNRGKHVAVNRATKLANGELFFIADSDDWLHETAIEDVISIFAPIREDNSFGGVCGLDAYADGKIVGSGLPQDSIDTTPQDIRSHYKVMGDLKEVFRTDVIRQFPFPEIEGEKFCPEVLIWNRIGKKYKLRYFNKPIYGVEYQEDGITSGITKVRMNSPVATMMTYAEWFDLASSISLKVRLAINYWRFAFCAPKPKRVKVSGWGKLVWPLGLMYHLKDELSIK